MQESPEAIFRNRVLAIVGAVVGGVGVVGFVAVVGGMVVWLRFDSLNLPADTAVAAIPRTNLIVIGLSTLIPFLILAFAAVFLAYVFAADKLVPSHPWNSLRSTWSGGTSQPANVTAAAAPPVSKGPDQAAELALRLNELEQQARGAAAAAESVAKVGQKKAAEECRDQVQAAQRTLSGEFGFLDDLGNHGPDWMYGLKAQRDRAAEAIGVTLALAEAAPEQAQQSMKRATLTLLGSGVVLVLFELGIVWAKGWPSGSQVFVLAVLGAALSAATLVIGRRTPGFAAFGTAIFVSIMLFGMATTLLRTYHEPKMQPIALLRSGQDRGLTGYFVAETSEDIYLVRVLGEQRHTGFAASFPRLMVIPRSNVIASEVGPLETQEVAYGASYRELQELCAQRVPEAANNATSSTACGMYH